MKPIVKALMRANDELNEEEATVPERQPVPDETIIPLPVEVAQDLARQREEATSFNTKVLCNVGLMVFWANAAFAEMVQVLTGVENGPTEEDQGVDERAEATAGSALHPNEAGA